jgi:hypothetical protein
MADVTAFTFSVQRSFMKLSTVLSNSILAIWVGAALPLGGCSLGPLKVRETHYLAVTNGKETNYYRLRVEATTLLGVAGFRSGWYPARAVDRLFGDVSSDTSPAELQAQTDLELQIIDKVKVTQEQWLSEAAKPDADTLRLKQLNEARRRVLAYPAFRPQPFEDTVEIEYNPGRNIVTFHADDKLLFVLSSNPDEVIQQISSFAEDDKTILTINRLAGTITQRLTNEVAERAASQTVDETNDARLRGVINQAIAATAPNTSKASAAAQIDGLVGVLEAVNP